MSHMSDDIKTRIAYVCNASYALLLEVTPVEGVNGLLKVCSGLELDKAIGC